MSPRAGGTTFSQQGHKFNHLLRQAPSACDIITAAHITIVITLHWDQFAAQRSLSGKELINRSCCNRLLVSISAHISPLARSKPVTNKIRRDLILVLPKLVTDFVSSSSESDQSALRTQGKVIKSVFFPDHAQVDSCFAQWNVGYNHKVSWPQTPIMVLYRYISCRQEFP